MNIGLVVSYEILNNAVEFDEPHRIAWRHVIGDGWRYTLERGADGTLAREEWDPEPRRWRHGRWSHSATQTQPSRPAGHAARRHALVPS